MSPASGMRSCQRKCGLVGLLRTPWKRLRSKCVSQSRKAGLSCQSRIHLRCNHDRILPCFIDGEWLRLEEWDFWSGKWLRSGCFQIVASGAWVIWRGGKSNWTQQKNSIWKHVPSKKDHFWPERCAIRFLLRDVSIWILYWKERCSCQKCASRDQAITLEGEEVRPASKWWLS